MADTNKQVLAEFIRANVRQYKFFSDFAEELEKLASKESNIAELEKAIEKLRVERAKVAEALEEQQGKHAEWTEIKNQQIASLNEQAEAIEKQAKANAAEIRDKANKDFANKVAKAEAKAQEITQKAYADLDQLTKDLEAKLGDLKLTESAVINKQSELADLEAKVAKAKAQIQKMLGE